MKYLKEYSSYLNENLKKSFVDLISKEIRNLDNLDITFKIHQYTYQRKDQYYEAVFPKRITEYLDYYKERYKEKVWGGKFWKEDLFYSNNWCFRIEYDRIHINSINLDFLGVGIGYKLFRSFLEYKKFYWTIDDDSKEASHSLWRKLINDSSVNKVVYDKGYAAISQQLSKSETTNIINNILPTQMKIFCEEYNYAIPVLEKTIIK